MLLEEVVASRVKHYLEVPKQRGQWKSMEHASSAPLLITGKISDIFYSKIRWKLLFNIFFMKNLQLGNIVNIFPSFSSCNILVHKKLL